MNLEELITTRNKYQCMLDDAKAFKRLSERVGIQNATANREWLRRKIKSWINKSKNYLDCKVQFPLQSYTTKINDKGKAFIYTNRISIQYQS